MKKVSTFCIVLLFSGFMAGSILAQECTIDSDCDDANPCTTDICEKGSGICLFQGCTALSPADPCCNDPVCEDAALCLATITLTPEDVWATPGGVLHYPVCLDNHDDLVGGIQFDLCEYSNGQPRDCMTCNNCDLTERTTLFDCAVFELPNGCCRVIVFTIHPGGFITPGRCNFITINHDLHEHCVAPMCIVHVPQNIYVSDNKGYQLPTYGYQGEVCFLAADTDRDGVPDEEDNCPLTPNGPAGGTCTGGEVRNPCVHTSECVHGGLCSIQQEDSDGDGIGDACECGVDADCNDGLWCTGSETCVSSTCVTGLSPCDDSNPCTTDSCDENYDGCLAKGCAALNPADPCCNDPVCEGAVQCTATITLTPEDVWVGPGAVLKKAVCLDNQNDLVGGIQFDLCEYIDGQPRDCMSCMDCEITERTTSFDCAVFELPNGCCRVIVFSKHPSGVINPGLCNIVTIYELHQGCTGLSCALQVPENIVAGDQSSFELTAAGFPGEVCFFCTVDADCDDGLFCTGVEICVDEICQPGTYPCPDDGLFCNGAEGCDEDNDICTHSGDPCVPPFICDEENDRCVRADVVLTQEDVFYNQNLLEGAIVKKHICLDNPGHLVGGIQFDECEYSSEGDPINCMECIDCELTERTTVFDCAVLELPNGCCRVLLFCKNPGCAINPGLCDIVTVVFKTFELSPECPGTDCELQIPENIIAGDYDGYQLTTSGLPGAVCPFVCGDVCPLDNPLLSGWDCGDGKVDIFDILCEVDFTLTLTTPDDCQAMRAAVPTGTPPYCDEPDGAINILDILVLIDMTLNRQDCCTFYYTGVIY